MTTFGAIVLGIILLVVGYNVPQPPPLNTVEIVIGWIALIVGAVMFLLGWIPPRDGAPVGRRWGRWR